jgi:hypothetical protein
MWKCTPVNNTTEIHRKNLSVNGCNSCVLHAKSLIRVLGDELFWLLSWFGSDVSGKFRNSTFKYASRDRSFSTTSRPRLVNRVMGFDSRQETRFFFSSQHTDQFWGPSSLLPRDTGGFFPRVKRPGREVCHSHPVPMLRKDGALHEISKIFVAWCLIIYRENFTFAFFSNTVIYGWFLYYPIQYSW